MAPCGYWNPEIWQTSGVPNLNGNVICRMGSYIFFPVFPLCFKFNKTLNLKQRGKMGEKYPNLFDITRFRLNWVFLGSAGFWFLVFAWGPYRGVFAGMPRILKQSAITLQ